MAIVGGGVTGAADRIVVYHCASPGIPARHPNNDITEEKSCASSTPVRYAVVGLGHIAQVAVLPAFAHARRNSKLVAVVSDDRTKRREMTRRYRLDHAFSYEQFDDCLNEVDAVYIALPNSMHAEYTVRAAKAGVHVLCEKPMAVTARECQRMIAACRAGRVKLMIAYRLHFETLNISAMEMARRGQLGQLKFFTSSFSMTVRRGDIRTKRNMEAARFTTLACTASTRREICSARNPLKCQRYPSIAA